jgi:hypothetical protein
MKRYQVCALALTTGNPVIYTMSDSPGEAYDMAQKLSNAGGRNVEILDAHTEKFYDLKNFAAEHRLG